MFRALTLWYHSTTLELYGAKRRMDHLKVTPGHLQMISRRLNFYIFETSVAIVG